MNKASRITFWSGLLFGLTALVGIVFTLMIIFRRKGDNEEPLLGH